MIPALLLLALQDPAPAPSARAAQRLELQRDVEKTNGAWKLYEWGHYFVLTDVRDPKFVDELERQAFEARELCVRLFPQSESDPVRDDRKLVVLRALRDQAEYHSFGGPGGSTSYWSTRSGEIVIHDDPDRGQTWESLAGSIARAFADELFGNGPRKPWFEDGLAEYVASCARVRTPAGLVYPGRMWREQKLRDSDLARWPSLQELIAGEKPAMESALAGIAESRAVAWSLMRFLCGEDRRETGFDARWAKIPERYAVGGVLLNEEAKARAFAFEGVDLAALEKAWRASLCVTR